MVWSDSQSMLNNAVERYNKSFDKAEEPVEIPKAAPEPKPKPARKPPLKRNNYNQPISRNTAVLPALFSDSDAILLTALIIILIHENADIKLILALAFVLLT